MNRERTTPSLSRRTVLTLLAAAILLVVHAPPTWAGGTEHVTTGDGGQVYFHSYHTGLKQKGVVSVYKLAEEEPGVDYYTVVNEIRQLSSKAWYDFPNFWTYMSQQTGPYRGDPYDSVGSELWPDLVDWAPGIRKTGTTPVAFKVSLSGGGPQVTASMDTRWDNHWCGQWDIASQGREPSNDFWKTTTHHEWFATLFWECFGSSRASDWDRLTFATGWVVRDVVSVGTWVGSAIQYCNDTKDCGKGPHTWDASPLVWVPLHKEDQGCDGSGDLGDQQECAWKEVLSTPGLVDASKLVPALDATGSLCVEQVFPDCDPGTPQDPVYWLGGSVEPP